MNRRIVDAPRVGAAATLLARCPPKDNREPARSFLRRGQ
jgi:hypothetical protein